MIFTTKIPGTAVGDCDKTSSLNIMNSDQSKCSKDIASTGETLSHQKDLLIDEPLAATVEQKENATQGDLKFATSEIDYTQICDNDDDNHTISASYVDAELSRLRQEQIDLGHERRKLESHAESVSSEMFAECQV
jgi:DNA excision repair protein ERCC-5